VLLQLTKMPNSLTFGQGFQYRKR